MVYLVKTKHSQSVRVFYSEEEVIAAGYKRADKTVTDEEYNSKGCYARLINGEIVVGKTEEEKEQQEKQNQIAGYLRQLEEIDRRSGASRHVRDVSVSAGVVLDAVRILLSRFAKELSIAIPNNFGRGLTTAEELLSLTPESGLSPQELEDFQVFKALLLLNRFDPAINPGLTELKQAEMEAVPIREQLAPLLENAE